MLKTLALSTFAAGFGLACLFPDTAPPAPVFLIIATDAAGDAWIAGRGDDCVAAWEGAQIPPDWREIVCIEGMPGQ